MSADKMNSFERFQRIKSLANTPLKQQRVLAYEQHLRRVHELSTLSEFMPFDYLDFQWSPCSICKTEIRDTAFGYNPAPLADTGVCCGECYKRACFTQLREQYGKEKAIELVIIVTANMM